jgi:hypothetical protein
MHPIDQADPLTRKRTIQPLALSTQNSEVSCHAYSLFLLSRFTSTSYGEPRGETRFSYSADPSAGIAVPLTPVPSREQCRSEALVGALGRRSRTSELLRQALKHMKVDVLLAQPECLHP